MQYISGNYFMFHHPLWIESHQLKPNPCKTEHKIPGVASPHQGLVI